MKNLKVIGLFLICVGIGLVLLPVLLGFSMGVFHVVVFLASTVSGLLCLVM